MVEQSNAQCCLLQRNPYTCRVSSVLNNNIKQYGKQFMFDNSEETCWNSKEGIPQWIHLHFENKLNITDIEIQFQGGFAGKELQIIDGNKSTIVETFYPEDINASQRFYLSEPLRTEKLKLVFPESTDFFGRIIVYKLCIY